MTLVAVVQRRRRRRRRACGGGGELAEEEENLWRTREQNNGEKRPAVGNFRSELAGTISKYMSSLFPR